MVNTKFIECPYYVDYAFPNVHTAIMYFVLEIDKFEKLKT